MSLATTITLHSTHYSLSTMDSPADKEERKREYNRLAQREFRRRRKEHLRNLEQAQKEQSSEQSEEIERLKYQNEELRRENENLKAQVYGSSASSSHHHLMSTPLNIPGDGRSYSLSPSISGASLSGISGTGSPPASLGLDMMPLTALAMTSSMLPPSMLAYADQSAMSSQPYSMVHQSGLRHNAQSSPESSGFRTSRSAMASSFQSPNVPQSVDAQGLQVPSQRSTSSQSSTPITIPYNRVKARAEILELFRPLLSDPSISTAPDRHLMVLRSMSESLPGALKPTKSQLETPHYYGIDLLPSPSLRDRLLQTTADVAQSFVAEIGITGEREDTGQLIIWGDDALNEMSWELSPATLERWGWLVGRDWVARTNFWRRQRGIPPLPDW